MEIAEIKEVKITQLEIVEKNSQNWARLLDLKDPKKMKETYAKNALFLPTFSNKLIKDAIGIENYFDHFFKQNPKVTFGESGFHFSSENSYTHAGMYTFEVDEKSARKLVEARFTYDWVKEDGEWKIAHHHSSLLPK